MTAKRFFNSKSSGLAMLFCALCLFVIIETETKSNGNNETVNINNPFQQQLLERSQKYLQSIHHHSANLSPEFQEKLKLHAQNTISKGLAKLNQPAKLVQKKAKPVDLTVLSNAVQKIEKNSALNVASFLSRDFHQVTEWEVVIRIALPLWDYRQVGRLTTKNSSTLFGRDVVNGTAMIVSGSSRYNKNFTQFLGQLVAVLSIETKSFSNRFGNNHILSGFTLIAQTVIRRE